MLAWDEIQKRRKASAEKLTAAGLQTSEGFLAALGDIDKRLQQQAAEKLSAEDRVRKEEDRQRAITRQTEADKAEAERAKNVEARAAAAEARAAASADVASREKARQEAAPIVDVMRRQGKTASEIGAIIGNEDRFGLLNDLDVEGVMREQAAIDEALAQKRSDEAARAAREEARFRAQQEAERQQRGLAFRQQKFREAESARDAALREADKRNQLYLEQQKMAAGPEARPLKPISDTTVAEITSDKVNLQKMANVSSFAKQYGISTGKIDNALMELSRKFGVNSPEAARFKQQVGSMTAEYIKSMSGATVSEAERPMLLANLPQPDDSDAVFAAKLSQIQQDIKDRYNIRLDVLKSAGRDVSGFESIKDQASTVAAPQDDEEALIDTMIRAGKSEQEIESAVEALRLTRGR